MATFSTGGLASGMDTNSIIDTLVQLESRPITLIQQRQTGMKTQISVLGDLASKLSSLQTAAKNLGTNGALGVKVASTHTDFTATATSSATAGRYQVQVTGVAEAAKSRSQKFDAVTDPVTAGKLVINSGGKEFKVDIGEGSTLADVAFAINQSGASVTAAVLTNSTGSYLSVTNKDTGHPIGTAAADALTFSHETTGTTGTALTFESLVTASNAKVTVDKLEFESTTDTISGAIPGVNITANKLGAEQTLILGTDADATSGNLKKFIDAYNDVIKVVQKQLNVTDSTNRDNTLAGDSTLRSLQQRMQKLISSEAGSSTSVRSLADLGVKTARDGSLSLDSATLTKALGKDPGAVNDLFSKATTGLSALTSKLVDGYTDPVDGLITSRKSMLNKSVSKMSDDMDRLQIRIDAFRKNLVSQYTAMEKVVSSLKSIGNYLTAHEAKSSGD